MDFTKEHLLLRERGSQKLFMLPRLGDVPRNEDDSFGVQWHEAAFEAPKPRRDARFVFYYDETLLLEGCFDAIQNPFGKAGPQVHLGDELTEKIIGRDDELIYSSGAVFEVAAIPVEGEKEVGKCGDEGPVLGLARLELLQFLSQLHGSRGDTPSETCSEEEEEEDKTEAGRSRNADNPEVHEA